MPCRSRLVDDAIFCTGLIFPLEILASLSDACFTRCWKPRCAVLTKRVVRASRPFSFAPAADNSPLSCARLWRPLRRFNDLNSIDKLANVQGKVDAVKGVMQTNIAQALKNTDRMEDIDEKAVVLADSASKFKNSAGSLKRNMRWRYIRMICIMTILVAAVLAVIIVPIVLSNK